MALQFTSTCHTLTPAIGGSLWLCILAVLLIAVHTAAAADATRTQQATHLADVDVCTLNAALLCTPHSERVQVVRANASALVLRICVVRAEGECFASVEKQRVVHTSNEHRMRRPHISRIKPPLTGLMPSSSTRLTCLSVYHFCNVRFSWIRVASLVLHR